MKREPVDHLLKTKANQTIYGIGPDESVYQAIARMAEFGVGALLVMDGETLVGVVSERDYARKVILKGRSSMDTPIHEIMTSDLITVGPRQSVEECMALMTNHKVRHLPVVERGAVLGVVSIGDLVKWIITGQERTIHQLESYIAGAYPG